MNRQYDQVVEFNRDILDIQERILSLQPIDEFQLSMTQLREEISEIEEGFANDDLVKVIDGLIDLEYYLLGIFYKHGLTQADHNTLFNIVHQANMTKQRGKNDTRPGFDAADAIKPDNWMSPDVLIANYLEVLKRVQKRSAI